MLWEELLMAAPDPEFYQELKAHLNSVELSAELPQLLNDTYVEEWEVSGLADRRQLASIWINLGMAAIELPSQSPEVAEFAHGCSELAAPLTASDPYLEMFRRFVLTHSLLFLAASEESTSPDICSGLLTENKQLIELIDGELSNLTPEELTRHLLSTFSLSLNALRLMFGPRRAMAALGSEIIEVAEAALKLADRAERLTSLPMSQVWKQIQSMLQTPASPVALLHAYAGMAHWYLEEKIYLLIDSPVGAHTKAALRHLEDPALRDHALTENLKAMVTLVKAELLLYRRKTRESLAIVRELKNAGSLSDEMKRMAWSIEGRTLFMLGDLHGALECLTRDACSSEELVKLCLSRWLGVIEEIPVVNLAEGDPLEEVQATWRLLSLICAKLGKTEETLQWTSNINGFLVDALDQQRGDWVKHLRQREPQIHGLHVGWQRSVEATLQQLEFLRAQQTTVHADIPLPSGPIPPNKPVPPSPPLQLQQVLTCLGPNTAIINPLVIEGRVFIFVARNQGSEPVLQLEGTAHEFLPLMDSLRRWDEVYQMHIRRGDDERRWISDGHSIFDETMDLASQILGKTLQDLLNDGFSKLVFIPDDLLADVPFHATYLQPSGRLLIEECEVSYAPSLYTLWECCRRQSKEARSRRGMALKHILDPELSSAMDEALEVATDLGGNLDVINPLGGTFWSDLSEAEVLHVVAHGKHQPLLPINSIFLQGWVDLPLSILIAGLDLPRCDLVSNLICESAMPAIRQTPAVDFSSVFLTAGARTVLASTWVVDDSLASEMARRFFKSWVDGASPAASFRRGLSDLRAGRESLPAFEWAGMRLVGAPNN
jgi:hypothetical protein